MLKGVNRSIIEVCDTGNPIFERVICFVRPECCLNGHTDLKTSAEKYVRIITEQERERKKLPLILKISIPTVTAVLGFIVGLLID